MKNRKTKKLLKNTTRRRNKQDKNKGGRRSYTRNNIYKQPLLKNNNSSLLNIFYKYFLDWLERKNNTKKKLIYYNNNKLDNLYSMKNTISQPQIKQPILNNNLYSMRNTISQPQIKQSQIKQPQIKQPMFNNNLLIPTQKTDSQKQYELEEFARRAFSNNNKKLQKNAIELNKIYTPKSLNNLDYLAYMQPINSTEKNTRIMQQRAREL